VEEALPIFDVFFFAPSFTLVLENDRPALSLLLMNPADFSQRWKPRLWFLYRLLARLRFLLAKESIHTGSFGERFWINPFSFVERMIGQGAFENERASFLRRHLLPDDLFIDIGANIGFFTIIAARTGVRVHAFEPHPRNYKRLLRNLRLNGFTDAQVQPHSCALGDSDGTVLLYQSLNDNYGMSSIVLDFSPDGFPVPLRRLDDLLPSPTSRCVIKIDVEGAELQVLDGAKKFLDTLKEGSLWLVEVHVEDGVDLHAVEQRFKLWGYHISYLDDRTGKITPEKNTLGDILLLAERPSLSSSSDQKSIP
jgi:FkbM family methyltransferase